MPELQLPIRILLANPPAGVTFAVQRGKTETRGNTDLFEPSTVTSDAITFEFSIRAADEAGAPNFLGPFVHGPKGGRFLYVNSGTSAGQLHSCWTRRAKLHLSTIDWKLVQKVCSTAGAVLEGRIAGTGRGGGPACASVPLIGGWQLKQRKDK